MTVRIRKVSESARGELLSFFPHLTTTYHATHIHDTPHSNNGNNERLARAVCRAVTTHARPRTSRRPARTTRGARRNDTTHSTSAGIKDGNYRLASAARSEGTTHARQRMSCQPAQTTRKHQELRVELEDTTFVCPPTYIEN